VKKPSIQDLTPHPQRTAVIVGASSGIGEALAHELSDGGWRLGLLSRRLDRLEALSQTLSSETLVRSMDVTHDDAVAAFEQVIDELGGVDLVIITAGTGHNNRDLNVDLDTDTVSVNVLAFMKVAQSAVRHFLQRGRGHLVGVSSIAALRGNAGGAAYAASKAFQSVYLDGLRELARESGLPIVVTEVQPGGVDTAMLKPDRPLPVLIRRLFVASPAKAASQILRAVHRQKKHAYITRRYGLVALLLKLLPRPG
jgi:short-subunit dehydrogenase